jgi:7-cyano-7-deazaguanine synthase
MKDRVVVMTSGGLDSTVLCHYADAIYDELHLISFNYGQRHKKELRFAERTAERLNTHHDTADIRSIAKFLTGSALTDDEVDVPEGHYTEETMRTTVVPNRNMIMFSMAIAYAIAQGAKAVLAAMHWGDHPIYPDCRPEFIKELNDATVAGNQGFAVDGFGVLAPFANTTKSGIVVLGEGLHVPFEETWSCYWGETYHCGRCGTCVERAEAFFDAGVKDPTIYDDPDYWKLVTNKGR